MKYASAGENIIYVVESQIFKRRETSNDESEYYVIPNVNGHTHVPRILTL